VIDTVVHAWNRNDAGTVAQLFEPNGVLVMPTGSVLRSRSAIRKRIMDERQGKLKDTTLRHTVENVSISGGTAVIKRQVPVGRDERLRDQSFTRRLIHFSPEQTARSMVGIAR
jgi:uncharacterized protein (TIGR02246 family)